MGFVYLVNAVGTRRYKIGSTGKTVDERMAELGTSSPYDLVLVLAVESSEQHVLERSMHERFAGYRKRGEWFEFDDETRARVIDAMTPPVPASADVKIKVELRVSPQVAEYLERVAEELHARSPGMSCTLGDAVYAAVVRDMQRASAKGA